MTEVEQPPQNGIDLSAAEDDDNSKARPADIEQDMREMERRKRVEAIMGSKLFREELERIVDSAREGGASGILQQLSDIVGVPVTRVGNVFRTSNCMVPINDIRGVESMGYAKGEKILRCKLAATFRLLDLYGWIQGLGAQITARLKVDQEYFLVNPYGLLYHELTASSLNKVDMQGQIVEQGTTNFGVNKSHFLLHSVVHAARPDIRCAIYIGCSPVVAISSLKTGLLPLTKDACVLGEITSHAYSGVLDEEERNKLVRNLGPNSKVILLANHGALCCGETIEEAFFAVCHIVQACETQLKLLPVGLDNLVLIPEESRKIIYDQSRRPPEDLEKKFAAALATTEAAAAEAAAKDGEAAAVATAPKSAQTPKWRVGGAEFEALMRMLDNAGYRTGYIYRHPLVKSEPPRPKNDVELPPAVSSLGYLLEEEELFKQGIWKKGDLRKGGDRSRWLNSPNVYQKVEVLETGTPDPKKITKWVAEGSPTHSTPVRIEDPLQFVPVNTNPKEFKRLQQQIKDNRRADKISAGPQSHILEGVTWDEANRIKDATVSQAGDHVVLMGAASKGIIQRGFQHNATVYKAPYAKNPFDNVTDDELNEYKRTVERKKKSIHGEYTDTDFSESEALSSLQTSGAQQTKQTTTTTTAAVSQSEPETSEHQVLRIETQQAPVPSQAEVVLSDATLSFINGERSHTATNRKPPTGREQEEEKDETVFSKNQNQIDDDDSDKENNCVVESNNQKYTPKCRRDLSLELQNEKILELKSQQQNNDNRCRNFVMNDDGKACAFNSGYCCMYYQQQQQQQQQQKKPDIVVDDVVEYDYATAASTQSNIYDEPYASVVLARCKPNLCGGVRHALHKPPNTFSNNLICNIPFSAKQVEQQSVDSTTSTADSSPLRVPKPPLTVGSNSSAVSNISSNPYRTTSHFGFVSPRQPPRADHKHIPLIVKNNGYESQNRYKPLSRTISYEEIFATPRYQELCVSCFENLLRFKPELTALARAAPGGGIQLTFQKSCCQSGAGALVCEFNDCGGSTNTEMATTTKQAGILEPLRELDEYELQAPRRPLSVHEEDVNKTITAAMPGKQFDDATVELTASSTAFLSKIEQMNFSEESYDPNYIPNGGRLNSISSDISMDDLQQQQKEQKTSGSSAPTSRTSPYTINAESRPSSDRVEFTEFWNFGNWQQRPINYNDSEFVQPGAQPLTERRVIFEVTQCLDDGMRTMEERTEDIVVDARMLMTREERLQRKLEFQELWEDHITYFKNKEAADKEEDNDVDCVVGEVTVTKTTTTTTTNAAVDEDKAESKSNTCQQPIEFDAANLGDLELQLPKMRFEQEPMIVEITDDKHEKDTKDYKNYERSRLLFLSSCSERTSEIECPAASSAYNYNNMHCQRLQADDAVSFTSGIGQSSVLSSSQAHDPPLIMVVDEEDEINTQPTTGRSLSSIPENNVFQIITQFEKNLSLAGKHLNTLVEIVANQYRTWQEDTFTSPPEYDDAIDMMDDAANSLGHGQEEDTQSCFSTKTFDIVEANDELSQDMPMEEMKKSECSVESDDKYVSASSSFGLQVNEREDGNGDEKQTMSHYITLENLSLAADDMPTRTDISNSYSNDESFASICLTEEQSKQTMEEFEEKQDTERTKECNHKDVIRSIDDIPEQTSSEEEEDIEVGTSNPDMEKFSTLERKILKKIKKNQLKNEEEIFDKIENTIRNKMTPSKLEMLVHQQLEESFQTQTSVIFSAREPACASTPKSETATKVNSFNFGNAFELFQPLAVKSNCEENEQNDDDEDDDDEQYLSEANMTEPCCSKYATQSSSRKSRSLTPTSSRALKSSISSSTFTTCSDGSSAVCRSYKTRRSQSRPTTNANSAINSSTSLKRRNFILENIRNASKPRPRAPTQGQLNTKHYCPKTYRKIASTTSTADTTDLPKLPTNSSVCSFETKVVGDSPRLWFSVPRTPSKRTPKKGQRYARAKRSLNMATPKKTSKGGGHVKRQRVEALDESSSEKKIKLQATVKEAIMTNVDLNKNSNDLYLPVVDPNDDNDDDGMTSAKHSSTTFTMVETASSSEDKMDVAQSCYSLESCESKTNIFVNYGNNSADNEEEEEYMTMTQLSFEVNVGISLPNFYDDNSEYDDMAAAKNSIREHLTGGDDTNTSAWSELDDEPMKAEENEELVLNTTCKISNFFVHITDNFGNNNKDDDDDFSNGHDEAADDEMCLGENFDEQEAEQENYIDSEKMSHRTQFNITLSHTCDNLSLDRNELCDIPKEKQLSAEKVLLITENIDENDGKIKNNRLVVFVKAENEEEETSASTLYLMGGEANTSVSKTHITNTDDNESMTDDIFPIESSSGDIDNSSSSETLPFNETSGDTIIHIQNFGAAKLTTMKDVDESTKMVTDLNTAYSSKSSVLSYITNGNVPDCAFDFDTTINPNHPFYEEVAIPYPLKTTDTLNTESTTIEDTDSAVSHIDSIESEYDDNFVVTSTRIQSVDDLLETSMPIPHALRTDIFASNISLELDDLSNDDKLNCSLHFSKSTTGIDSVIEALGEEIEQMAPRLLNYKCKIDELDEHVSKCARQIDDCVVEQMELQEQHERLHEDIVLNQYAEEVTCKANTYSLSETDD